jgi:hypothetical protein
MYAPAAPPDHRIRRTGASAAANVGGRAARGPETKRLLRLTKRRSIRIGAQVVQRARTPPRPEDGAVRSRSC